MKLSPTFFFLNPLSPHDALKHHFTSLKTDLIFLQLGVLEYIFRETVLPIHSNFRHFSPTSNHLHSLQVENCGSNSRLVVNEDDYGKFSIERINMNISDLKQIKNDYYSRAQRLKG